MKSYVSLISLAVFSVTLTACLHNRSNDYVNAQSTPDLKTPAGITSAKLTDNYPVPPKSTTEVVPAPSLVPPGLTEDEAAAKVALAEAKKKAKNSDNVEKSTETQQQ